MKNRIIVVGSYNVDITIQTERLPKPGETVLGNSIAFHHGGKGANQAVAAARSGAHVTLIARIGADVYGDRAAAALETEGIQTNGIIWDTKNPTGMASITVNNLGENCIVAVSGSNSMLSPYDIDTMNGAFKECDILLVQLETPLNTVRYAIHKAYQAGKTVILDPAPAQSLPPELLEMVTVITPNQNEAELLTGISINDENDMQKAADHLLSSGIKVVLLTLGERGVFVATRNSSVLIPAVAVKAIDSTGAGDVFNGVLASRYSADEATVFDAVRYAAAAASLSVTREGAQSAIPTDQEIQDFIGQLEHV